eukprot:2647724-Karenia_brevis.AAC.1
MLEELVTAASKVGLEVHMGKTAILTNSVRAHGGAIKVLDGHVAIKSDTDYLGRKLSFHELHDIEIQSRIDKAWKKFFACQSELCGKHVDLRSKLRLFQAVVTPSLLYGSGTWTLSANREKEIRTAQRRMLRWMVGSRRHVVPQEQHHTDHDASYSSTDEEGEEQSNDTDEEQILEPWQDWIQRVTHVAEDMLKKCNLDDWVTAQKRKKFRWAGHLARRADKRWSTTLLRFQPLHGYRDRGHPVKRWADDINRLFMSKGYAKDAWLDIAQDRERWTSFEEEFIQ